MSNFHKLNKKVFPDFIENIIKSKTTLIAPVNSEIIRFQKINQCSDIELFKQTQIPAKNYFFRNPEKIFNYSPHKIKKIKITPRTRVFFGLRRCDLSAIAHQDQVFIDSENPDPFYKSQRKNSLLIGLHCNKALTDYCFCGSLKLPDFYDLMFFNKKDYFLIHVGSKTGQKFLKKQHRFIKPLERQITSKDRYIPGTSKLKSVDLKKFFNHPAWEKGAQECLSCSACTTWCPTCYCHEIQEKPDLTQAGCGSRERYWSSCQLKSFTKVAGNHIFRSSRLERFKHRIYHQLQYFKEKKGVNLCVGCGRCITNCPTRINFLEIINNLHA